MTALEKLITRYQRDLYKPEREHLRREELEAMQIYNEICHELAEKIRVGKGTYYPTSRLGGDGWIADAAADLIDPEHDGS